MAKLTDDHKRILRYVSKEPALAQWVAEGCDHAYETPWASSRLRSLAKRRLVERIGIYWHLTPAGRTALEEEGR